MHKNFRKIMHKNFYKKFSDSCWYKNKKQI